MQQIELFEPEAMALSVSVGVADPEKVRQKLIAMLDELREGSSRTEYIGTVFPQMVRWLPDLEAKQFLSEFQKLT